MPRKTKHRYICLTCNAEFWHIIPPHSDRSPKYCSQTCYHNRSDKPKRKDYELMCEFCKQAFVSTRSHAKFCSLQCFGKSRRKGRSRICFYCNNEFYVQPSHPDLYCSRACHDVHKRYEPIRLTCKTCECGFLTDYNKGNHVYCSAECRDSRPLTGIMKPCQNCDGLFYVVQSHKDNERFCSRNCRLIHQGPTDIEELLINELDKTGIDYSFQYSLGPWILDFAFLEYRLAVEADGVYWHSLPENLERDKRKDTWLLAHGWAILRLAGPDVKKSPEKCINMIIAQLNGIC